MAVLRIGEVRLCFVPGEPFGSVERAIVEKTGLNQLRVVGYSNGAPGYIFGPDEESDGGYEVMSSPLTAEAWGAGRCRRHKTGAISGVNRGWEKGNYGKRPARVLVNCESLAR